MKAKKLFFVIGLAAALLSIPSHHSLSASENSTEGREVFVETHKCNMCHAVPDADIASKTQSVKMKGPDLPTGTDRDFATVAAYLRKEADLDGQSHKKGYVGTDEELELVLTWLGSLAESEVSAMPLPTETTAAVDATTVLVVRHAEKQTGSSDPELTLAGEERSHRLRDLAANAGVTGIYASQYKRTQATVRPLADARSLEVRIVDAGDTPGLVARILSENPGGVVVVAGHSNTVPSIVAALGAEEPDEIPETDYDNLFVVTVGGSGSATILRLKY